MVILLMAIGEYFIGGYWWLLIDIILVDIGGYLWLFCYKPLLVILLVMIDDYFINDF
jgi:hypothetical protein